MIYTAGQNVLTRKQLNLIKVPTRDNVSANWKGLNHGVLASTLVKRIEKQGLVIARETWYTNPKRDTLWGAIDILPENASPTLEIGQDAKFSLGVRHSNLGRYAVSFAVGANVTVCSNGVFAGDFLLKKRHTQSLELEPMIDEGIDRYIRECENLEAMINGWRGIDLDNRDASYLILKAHSEGYVNFAHLETVDSLWRNPPHEEFAPRTAWSLYNAFTEMAKTIPVPRQMRLLTGLRKIYNEELPQPVLN